MLIAQIQESLTILGDGTVLVAGGWICPGNSTVMNEYGPDNRAEIYDPVTDTFTATGNMMIGRSLRPRTRGRHLSSLL
jgi:methylmalonyl-CoA mutase cobalamin-binding subunit